MRHCTKYSAYLTRSLQTSFLFDLPSGNRWRCAHWRIARPKWDGAVQQYQVGVRFDVALLDAQGDRKQSGTEHESRFLRRVDGDFELNTPFRYYEIDHSAPVEPVRNIGHRQYWPLPYRFDERCQSGAGIATDEEHVYAA